MDLQNATRESSMTMRRIARTSRLLKETGHPDDVIGALEDLKRCHAALDQLAEAASAGTHFDCCAVADIATAARNHK